jgi:hypothetical protein
VLGKASHGQLLAMVLLEVPVHALNQKLVFDMFKALEIGEEDHTLNWLSKKPRHVIVLLVGFGCLKF